MGPRFLRGETLAWVAVAVAALALPVAGEWAARGGRSPAPWWPPGPLWWLVPCLAVWVAACVLRHPWATLTSLVFNVVGLGICVAGERWTAGRPDYADLGLPALFFSVAWVAGLVGVGSRSRMDFELDRVGALASAAVAAGSFFLISANFGLREEALLPGEAPVELVRTELAWPASVARAVAIVEPDGATRIEGARGGGLVAFVDAQAPVELVLPALEHWRRDYGSLVFAAEGRPFEPAAPPLFRPRPRADRRFAIPFAPEGSAADAALAFPAGTPWRLVVRGVEDALARGARSVSLRVAP